VSLNTREKLCCGNFLRHCGGKLCCSNFLRYFGAILCCSNFLRYFGAGLCCGNFLADCGTTTMLQPQTDNTVVSTQLMQHNLAVSAAFSSSLINTCGEPQWDLNCVVRQT
jgi:hypothetical protein